MIMAMRCSVVPSYLVNNYNLSKRTTTVERAGIVKGTLSYDGYGYSNGDTEGLLISGSTSSEYQYPVPLGHTYTGNLTYAPGENDNYCYTEEYGSPSFDESTLRGYYQTKNSYKAPGYQIPVVTPPYAEGNVTTTQIGVSQPQRGESEMPEDMNEMRLPYYMVQAWSHPYEGEPEKTSMMYGVTTPGGEHIYTPWDCTDLLLKSGAFYKMTSTGTFPQYRAYLRIPEQMQVVAGVPEWTFNIVFDDQATGIDETVTQPTADVWYTLQGTRLNERPSQPGVYILNGKKVVVK